MSASSNNALTINPEAERAVIAALMRNPDGAAIIHLGISTDLFTQDEIREAFIAIAAFIADGIRPDAATLRSALSNAVLIEVETSLQEHASAANLPAYVSLLKACRRERAVQAARKQLEHALAASRPSAELQVILDSIQQAQQSDETHSAIPPLFRPFTETEMIQARLHPKCIVENYLYADLALMCAAGGTGKTTLLLYEAVCIATGRDLWGFRVLNPGATLFITAEDSRDLFAARLREIVAAIGLSDCERRLALEHIAVWDVSSDLVRLAELDPNGNIRLTGLADQISRAYQGSGLVQIVFDPAISFSPGERVVNDGEQAVVTACRRIVRGLNCCVRLIHHTGKVNARNGALDQYAGRGGTALPDGCRMVAVMSSVGGENLPPNPPEGFDLAPGDSGFILARAKLSYAPPQPTLWIRRRGFTFEYFIDKRRRYDGTLAHDADRVASFIADELTHGRKYSANTLDRLADSRLKLTRTRLRTALAELETTGRVVLRDLPVGERRGVRKTYLYPLSYSAAVDGGIAEKNDVQNGDGPAIPPPAIIPPPYREYKNGGIAAAFYSPISLDSAEHYGGIAAEWRNSGESPTDETILPSSPTVAWTHGR